jgi:hypothetical protein
LPCRAASYQAYSSPRELDRTLKLGDGFSRHENITGIHNRYYYKQNNKIM